MFLSIYLFKINIIHKSEKNHNNVDDLSKILINYVKINFYLMTIINVNENFLKEFKNVLAMNFHFHVIYEKLQIQTAKTLKNMIYHSYRLNTNIELLYFINKSNSNCICISANLKKKILKFVYNNYVHESFYKTIDRLRSSAYFFKMRKKVRNYIKNCSIYQFSKSNRRPSYKKLHSIKIIAKSLAQLFMNFIMIFSIIT